MYLHSARWYDTFLVGVAKEMFSLFRPKYDKEATIKKPVNTIAKEVIAGKWDSGEERKKRLTAAGYDYAEVQAAVNKMLK